MAHPRGQSTVRSMMNNGKNTLLPPKIPIPGVSSTYTEYIPISLGGQKALPNPRNGGSTHQRTSSESFLLEEQPCWLDELLNEPETPVRKGGHRRSSSDSFAYFDTTNIGSMSYIAQDDDKLKHVPVSSWGSQELDLYRGMQRGSFFVDSIPSVKTKNTVVDSSVSSAITPGYLPSHKEKNGVPYVGPVTISQDSEWNRDPAESVHHDPKGSERKESSLVQSSASETDSKRAKQQFAQRSRVRKLQYIAELERNVHFLQTEGSEISAELEFLNQQNLILSMENKALKQRLESLAQEQLIKYMEHEVLEREVGRLRNVYQQHQQPQQQISTSHRRSNSRDLDQQFANISLKYKEPNPGHDSLPGQPHT